MTRAGMAHNLTLLVPIVQWYKWIGTTYCTFGQVDNPSLEGARVGAAPHTPPVGERGRAYQPGTVNAVRRVGAFSSTDRKDVRQCPSTRALSAERASQGSTPERIGHGSLRMKVGQRGPCVTVSSVLRTACSRSSRLPGPRGKTRVCPRAFRAGRQRRRIRTRSIARCIYLGRSRWSSRCS
jgi:hypothetical protein